MFDDDQLAYPEPFKEQNARHAFISKVYTIISIQLLFTLGVVSLFVFVEEVSKFAQQNKIVLWGCMGVTFLIMIVMVCCESVRRTSPQNIICLILFTLAESFLVGFMSSYYNPQMVFLAVAITAVVTIALTIFAIQTKIDFTMFGGVLVVLAIILFIMGIVSLFYKDKIFLTIYASVGVLIFSIYLIYDTQKLMGNKENAIDTSEYVFAALSIYVDIIHMFQYILLLLGLWEE